MCLPGATLTELFELCLTFNSIGISRGNMVHFVNTSGFYIVLYLLHVKKKPHCVERYRIYDSSYSLFKYEYQSEK